MEIINEMALLFNYLHEKIHKQTVTVVTGFANSPILPAVLNKSQEEIINEMSRLINR